MTNDNLKFRETAKLAFEEMQASLGSYMEKISQEEKKQLEEILVDAAKIPVLALSTSQYEVEIAHINSQIANITLAATYPLRKVVWNAIRKVAVVLLTAAITAAVNKI